MEDLLGLLNNFLIGLGMGALFLVWTKINKINAENRRLQKLKELEEEEEEKNK